MKKISKGAAVIKIAGKKYVAENFEVKETTKPPERITLCPERWVSIARLDLITPQENLKATLKKFKKGMKMPDSLIAITHKALRKPDFRLTEIGEPKCAAGYCRIPLTWTAEIP